MTNVVRQIRGTVIDCLTSKAKARKDWKGLYENYREKIFTILRHAQSKKTERYHASLILNLP